MNALLLSDLHLTLNERDEYRWRIFSWIDNAITEHNVQYLFLLGDLTSEKDRHPARLVNRLVSSVLSITDPPLKSIYILRGNHDGIDPNNSFFKFLGRYENIHFIETPYAAPFDGKEVLFLPHTRDHTNAWKSVEFHRADYVLLHATVTGAVSETGQALSGIPASALKMARRAKIYSGDIHGAQVVSVNGVKVTYIGAPHHVNFGDTFEPRALLLKNFSQEVSLRIPGVRRCIVTVTADKHDIPKDLSNGDQIKARLRLRREEYCEWATIKTHIMKQCEAAGVVLCGVELEKVESSLQLKHESKKRRDVEDVFDAFCSENNLSRDLSDAGRVFLGDTQ